MSCTKLQKLPVFFVLSFSVFGQPVHGPAAVTGTSQRPVRYVSRPANITQSFSPRAAGAAGPTLPTWQATAGSYTYQMVGASPLAAGAGTTTIPTVIVPITLKFSDGTTFDPTVTSTCSTQSPLSLVQSSPLFNSANYTVGGTNVGTTQFADYFQRAGFWQSTGTTGISPNYHILLSASTLPAVQIAVPAASGKTTAAGCGRLGEMDINWFDSILTGTVFPALSSIVQPSALPVFVLENVVMYESTATNCCILGYHSGFGTSSSPQTYVVADFDTSNSFGSSKDVAAMSHEIGEWLDDPTGNNPTPAWGKIGQVSACQGNLEVGDPLSGTNFTVTMSNAYVYHLQELAFKSWFFRDTPSTGVNGWYSSRGTFTTPSKPCNTSTTSLTISPTSLSPGSAATVKITVAHGTGSSGTPGGTVMLVDSLSTTPVATYTLSAGAVNTTINTLPPGSYTVTANYAGDTNFGPSSSAPASITVGAPSVTLTPISLTFPGTTVGNSSATQSVTISNQGTAPLIITSISLTGGSPGDFTETNTCGASLAVKATCTVVVTFKPAAAGTRTASLSVADNATGSPQTVALTGTAAAGPPAPRVTLSSSAVTFPATLVGSASPAQTVTITNSGNAVLSGIAVTKAGANPGDYTEATTCAPTLAAAANCTVTVTFRPTVASGRSATISIADNATGAPQIITLSGTGASPNAGPKATLKVTSLTFPATVVGSTSATQTATLTNTGTGALTLAAVYLTGTNATDFIGYTTCGQSLAATASCNVTVSFKPKAAGTRTGSVVFVDNAPGSAQSVALSGTASIKSTK